MTRTQKLTKTLRKIKRKIKTQEELIQNKNILILK